MTKTELLEFIRNGESSAVEFKRDTLENYDLAKALVAFANARGGKVLLGVEDDAAVVGTTRAKLEDWVMQTCRDKIRPEIIPSFERIRDVEPGKDVAVVHVERGWTVHHQWHSNHSTYYIRVGSINREASREDLEQLFQRRGGFRVELRPVSGTTFASLDVRRLKDYFARIRQQETPQENEPAAWRSLLANTEFLESDRPDAPATVSGLLLFGLQPNRFLPQAGIDAAAYPGAQKDYATTERQQLRGPMTPLMDTGGQLVESGLVDQALEFCRRNLRVVATLEGGLRRETWPYPQEALREALVNALVHRDYLLSASDVELSLYEDRLEVISPGRPPNGINPERMRAGCRASRNQLLKDVMRDYGYLEHMGMGIPRKIVKLTVEQNGTQPDLDEIDDSFLVRLRRRPATEGSAA